MIKIKQIIVRGSASPGCTNGNYPSYTIVLDDGRRLSGSTCRCWAGCNNTDRLDGLEPGQAFENVGQLEDWLDGGRQLFRARWWEGSDD